MKLLIKKLFPKTYQEIELSSIGNFIEREFMERRKKNKSTVRVYDSDEGTYLVKISFIKSVSETENEVVFK